MNAQAKVITVWALYALGIAVVGVPFIGIIFAHLFRSTNIEPGLAGHNAAQRRVFWWALLGWGIAIAVIIAGMFIGIINDQEEPPTLMWFGLLIGIAVQLVFTIYAIFGCIRALLKKNWPGHDTSLSASAVLE